MGISSEGQLDAWLRSGGQVVASSERAARAVAVKFHKARRAEGLGAWDAPRVQSWQGFVRAAWEAQSGYGRLLLNAAQEQAIWADVIAESGHAASLLEQSRFRLAASASEAYALLCDYAPRFLDRPARSAWTADAFVFSNWLARFEEICREQELISPARVPFELASSLKDGAETHTPLLLAGFDRLLPVQRRTFDLWGNWQQLTSDLSASDCVFYAAPDEQAELAACARWCNRKIEQNPTARILVIAQNAGQRRGAIERAFLKHNRAPYEFSLGTPLGQVGLVRAALLLLRWLNSPLGEQDVDWLLASGYGTATPEDSAALQSHMRALRHRGLERPRWIWSALINRRSPASETLSAWGRTMEAAQRRLTQAARSSQSPLSWADLVPQFLSQIGWPGRRALTSAEFQARERWQQALDVSASLGFDGRLVGWQDYLSSLSRILDETLFAPESQDSTILIAGPSESAGLSSDAIWFLGGDEDAWPARGALHPLLPAYVQREARMPHASAQLDWDLAHAVTNRVLASASQVRFTYARQKEGMETRPSRLLAKLAGTPKPMPAELTDVPATVSMTETFIDSAAIPYPGSRQINLRPIEIAGGAAVLTSQSQCPFKAFATARLGARGWEPAQDGLTPAQRGQLLHAVLHSVWGSAEDGIRTHDQLNRIPDLTHFVATHVRRVIEEELFPEVRESIPARYLELEAQRLTRVVAEWLQFERGRIPFRVSDTERDAVISVAGLSFKLRLDRVDLLNDDSVLIIDYKTGNVSQRSWDLPRPEDVQLPLYAGFAFNDEHIGGLVFAKVRPGDFCFEGKVGSPASTLMPGLKNTHGLMRNALTAEQLLAWKEAIEQLARDFLAGRADVDPRDYPGTCERCGLHTLCRVQERTDEAALEDEAAEWEADHD
jgi:probable DNA repair protein